MHLLYVYPRPAGRRANGKILTPPLICGVSAEYFIKNGGYESGGPCERLKINTGKARGRVSRRGRMVGSRLHPSEKLVNSAIQRL